MDTVANSYTLESQFTGMGLVWVGLALVNSVISECPYLSKCCCYLNQLFLFIGLATASHCGWLSPGRGGEKRVQQEGVTSSSGCIHITGVQLHPPVGE